MKNNSLINIYRWELHIFILWHNVKNKRDIILKELNNTFNKNIILKWHWDSTLYISNLERFYLLEGNIIKSKLKHIWKWDFDIIIVYDKTPIYREKNTSSWLKFVNTNIFNLKQKYRKITGWWHLIHWTDSIIETKYQLFLLFWKQYNEILENIKNWNKIEPIVNTYNLFEINSFKTLFSILNNFSNYVILRNYNSFWDNYINYEHNDIDILIIKEDFKIIKSLLNLKKVYNKSYRVHYKTQINNQIIYFDFRFIWDNYYDINWEKDILKNRVKYNNFYIPDKENYNFSLLYHSLIHKKIFWNDYKNKLKEIFNYNNKSVLFSKLNQFLLKNNYKITEPNDISVYFNSKYIKKYLWIKFNISFIRRINLIKSNIKKYLILFIKKIIPYKYIRYILIKFNYD